MNNWLRFSLLSPQENPSPSGHQHQISGADDVAGDSFDPTLDLPPHHHASFGALEAFRVDTSSHDWNVKGLRVNPGGEDNYESAANDMPMIMGNSYNTDNTQNGEEPPKLENFLGGGGYMFQSRPLMRGVLPSDTAATTTSAAATTTNERASDHSSSGDGDDNGRGNINNNNSMGGLSVMKCWLRNQHQQLQENKNMVNGTCSASAGSSAQSLSLSVTSSQSPLPLLGAGSSASINGGGDHLNRRQRFSPDDDDTNHPTNNQHHHNGNSSSMGLDGEAAAAGAIEATPRKTIDTFGQRTSIYRGVTRHRWTGRYEAHLWDNSCRREGQTRKGRQVYLGGYDKEEKAARAYDLAALKYWGTTTTTNFPISNYEKELEEMKHMTRQEYVASLRRKSSGFSRGASIYRGVTRHHQHGRWQARIGRVAGNKDLYLGTFSTQEEAAEAYDIAAIKFRGLNAVTNFDMSRYDVKSILESSTLPIGKRFKDLDDVVLDSHRGPAADDRDRHLPGVVGASGGYGWPSNISLFQQQQQHSAAAVLGMMHYPSPNRDHPLWCKQEDHDSHNTNINVATNGLLHGHQLQLGTHDFFQHNLVGMDSSSSSSSMDHTSGSSDHSAMYTTASAGGGGVGLVYGSSHGSIPLATVIGSGYRTADGEVNLPAGSTPSATPYDYHPHRSMYCHQSSVVGGGAAARGSGASSPYDHHHHHQGSACNNSCLPAALGNRSTTLAVCPAPPVFTSLWNDT